MHRVSQHNSARTSETSIAAPRVRELAPHALRRIAGRALTTAGLTRPTAEMPRLGTGGLR